MITTRTEAQVLNPELTNVLISPSQFAPPVVAGDGMKGGQVSDITHRFSPCGNLLLTVFPPLKVYGSELAVHRRRLAKEPVSEKPLEPALGVLAIH